MFLAFRSPFYRAFDRTLPDFSDAPSYCGPHPRPEADSDTLKEEMAEIERWLQGSCRTGLEF